MAPNEVTFSAVIPCYNDHKRISRAVHSCIEQSLKPCEVIIVDDGSNNETRQTIDDLASRYAHQGVRAIHLERNSGVSIARNTGIANAKGSYVCFMDSDDAWHFDKLKISHQIITQLGEVALGTAFTFDLKDLALPRASTLGKLRRVTTLELLVKNPLMTSSWVVPNNGMEFSRDFRYSEDHEFLLRLSRQVKIYYLSEKLSYQDRPVNASGGLSGNKWKMRKGEMKMYLVFCKANWLLMPMLPIFILYSLAKHGFKIVRNAVR
jgi:glycosyltransferase involved in cell wall biosynthesis